MNTQQSIGAKIRLRRKLLKLTQEDLAELVGVARQTVSAWERGSFVPDGENLIALARVLKISIDYLSQKSSEGGTYQAQEDVIHEKKEALGLGYWGTVVDRAREASAREDPDEIAEIEHMLKLALRALESVKGQTEVVCQPKCLERPYDDGAKSA